MRPTAAVTLRFTVTAAAKGDVMNNILVFGYGSLLDQECAECTVPDIKYLYNALLPGYRVACTRFSRKRGGGVADVVPDRSCDVWGAVYCVDESGLTELDRREGVHDLSYRREYMTVFRDGYPDHPAEAAIYTVVEKSEEVIPCADKYRNIILRGAWSRCLPDQYIHLLRSLLVTKRT